MARLGRLTLALPYVSTGVNEERTTEEEPHNL